MEDGFICWDLADTALMSAVNYIYIFYYYYVLNLILKMDLALTKCL